MHVPDRDGSRPARGPLLSTRTVVLAFAAVEAALIGWALLSGRIH